MPRRAAAAAGLALAVAAASFPGCSRVRDRLSGRTASFVLDSATRDLSGRDSAPTDTLPQALSRELRRVASASAQRGPRPIETSLADA